VAYVAFAGLAVLRLWRKIMKRRRARQHAYAKNQLHTMIERGDIAGLILALFFIIVVRTVVALVRGFFSLVKKIGSLVVATTHTTIFAIQLAVARNRALQGSNERTRWFGRATITRAADIIVFARCWPLKPNTFVARRVLKIAGDAAIIALQSGDMTPEEARIWLSQIKQQSIHRSAQATEAQSHPLFVRVRQRQADASEKRTTASTTASQPPVPLVVRQVEPPLEDIDPGDMPDDVSQLLDEEREVIQRNRRMS
jgi:hypothetical protein